MTDLEGASGVYKFTQTRETDTPWPARRGSISWATWPPWSAGCATPAPPKSMRYDGHGNQAFIPHLMEPGAKYATGKPKPGCAGMDAILRRHGAGGLARDDGHARRRAPPHPNLEDGEPLLVQRRRIGRTGPSRGSLPATMACRRSWSPATRRPAARRGSSSATPGDRGGEERHRARGGHPLSVRGDAPGALSPAELVATGTSRRKRPRNGLPRLAAAAERLAASAEATRRCSIGSV